MLQPAIREGREVGIVTEDLVWRLELLQLYKHAFVAHKRVKRIETLHFLYLVRSQVSIRGRRHTEIAKSIRQHGVAEAAYRNAHRYSFQGVIN